MVAPAVEAHEGLRYLRPDEYPLWDALVETSPQGSVFCRSWCLNAVSGESRILGFFDKGRLVAGIPLHFEKRFGITLCCMSKLTPAWGVVMEPLQGKRATAAAREMEILGIFAKRLAQERNFVQAFHPSLKNWLPFYWMGFRQTSRFTYVLDDLRDPSQIWNEMRDSCRRQIRKAEKSGVVVSACDPETVLEAAHKTFHRQGIKQTYTDQDFLTLSHAALEKDSGICFAARDGSGKVHAAAFLIWDRKRAYYLAGGGDPTLRESGATSLLMWHLIQYSAARSAVFDFEGSLIEPIERFFRTFGARQEPYNFVTKFPRWMGACLLLAGRI